MTPHEAEQRLAAGYLVFLSPIAVQLKPPPGYSPDNSTAVAAGSFQHAWQPKLSANYLVWQMRSSDENR